MNYRRGFRRVYLIVSLVWIAGVCLSYPSAPNWFIQNSPDAAVRQTWLSWLGKGMSMAIVPPVLGYVLFFYVFRWVYNGFREQTRD